MLLWCNTRLQRWQMQDPTLFQLMHVAAAASASAIQILASCNTGVTHSAFGRERACEGMQKLGGT
jgi:hypothetical protein